ncbi:peptidase domain-containing ABC transporter [Parachitinimonas caeni]|uniref:Type I secretion system permease/ATPase n=1 Tax=Parachitinimonas caeni TaxID=3031301 RepID=A0ABT7DZF3_9NEIS|nr:type I secretion system permease/ATPase [Parachitinimonas caeni]MDK2125426.1 type I secretion system permease/ATPase [Parachitinimonas caeni]
MGEPDRQSAMNPQDQPLDTGLASLVLAMRLLHLPVEYLSLRHVQANRPLINAQDLVSLVQRLGHRARRVKPALEGLADLPQPSIVPTRDGHFAVIAAVVDGQVLYHDPREGRPESLSLAAFSERWAGEVVLVAAGAQQSGQPKFDISWFTQAMLRFRQPFVEVMLASVALQLLALATPLLFQMVIDTVLVHRAMATLLVVCVGMAGLIVFDTVIRTVRGYILFHTTSRMDVELGARLYRHLLSLPVAYFLSRRVGDTLSRVRELENIREFITSSAITLLIDLVFATVFLVAMFLYSPMLSGIVALSLLGYVVVSVISTPILKRKLDEKFERGAEVNAFLIESIHGVEAVKGMAVEPLLQHRWERRLASYVKSGFAVEQLGLWVGGTVQTISKFSFLLVLYFGALEVMGERLTVGQLVAFNMLASQVTAPILRIAELWQRFQQMRLSVERLGDILNASPEVTSLTQVAMPKLRGQIDMENVAFRYQPDGKDVLSNISLRVEPGQMIGVVGQSGSGKSTLAKLALRLYLPTEGRVLVDGVDISTIDPASLRSQVGVVAQENMLFMGSIRDNIAFGHPQASLAEVMEAARLAGAHEFISALPAGYDTAVEERGSNFSGGQRQRIAIARALLRNPSLLIFDEATSALDVETEQVIQRNLQQIAHGRTMLIIAHRLSAVRQCDVIITLEQGRIVEMGNHDTLLASRGRYADMWSMQAVN